MKYLVSSALAAATIVSAAPAACNAPANFKIAAQTLNDTSVKSYVQAYDNAGSDSYQFFFITPQSGPGYASVFSFDTSTSRISTSIQSNTGSTVYSSLAPTVNNLLNLTTTQSDPSGDLAVSCLNGIQYLVDASDTAQHPNNPWLQCQIPGWTTGLTQIYYNPVQDTTGIDNHEGGVYPCTRVGLALTAA